MHVVFVFGRQASAPVLMGVISIHLRLKEDRRLLDVDRSLLAFVKQKHENWIGLFESNL